MFEPFIEWLVSPIGAAVAGWGGLIVSIVGFWITSRAAIASKLAAERALSAITSIDVLQNMNESVIILGHLKGLHQDKDDPRIISLHYSEVTKLLLEAAQSRNILDEAELAAINSVILHSKLAQREYGILSREKKYELDHAQLLENLIDDESTLTSIHAAIRSKIGEDYVRHKSRSG